jgi:5'-3' exonuclease
MFKKDCLQKNGDDYVIREEDLGLFYHMFLRKIMPFITSYKDCIFCFEGIYSTKWRKEVFPPYKENRKDTKEDPNYKWVGPMMEKMLEYLSYFHCKTLKVDYCEGDDCIYQVCKYYAEKGEHIRIISSDKDLSQIINFYPEQVTQYNPIKQINIEKNENILLEKALVGDASDNIKAFKGIGPKTFEKMLEDKEVWNKKMTPANQQMLETVMSIIDLRKYPQKYQDAIKAEIEKPWNEFDEASIEKFLLDNGLKVCYNDWTTSWINDIRAQDYEQKEDAMEEIMDILKGV